MKLRIKGNSLRLRLTRTEVQRLVEQGSVEETTAFTDAIFTYSLRSDTVRTSLSAEYSSASMTITVPESQAKQWASSEMVGLYGEVATAHGVLTIAVEKDFACIDRNDPEDVDAFPNPKRDGC